MKIKIIYGTNSGGTRLVAEEIADVLKQHSSSVKVQDVADAEVEDIKGYDLVIFGSCTWGVPTKSGYLDGQLQQQFRSFEHKLHGKSFRGQKFAVFGLGDSDLYRNFAGAADHLEKLVKNIKGKLVGEVLKVDNYYFEPEKNKKKIRAWAKSLI